MLSVLKTLSGDLEVNAKEMRQHFPLSFLPEHKDTRTHTFFHCDTPNAKALKCVSIRSNCLEKITLAFCPGR